MRGSAAAARAATLGLCLLATRSPRLAAAETAAAETAEPGGERYLLECRLGSEALPDLVPAVSSAGTWFLEAESLARVLGFQVRLTSRGFEVEGGPRPDLAVAVTEPRGLVGGVAAPARDSLVGQGTVYLALDLVKRWLDAEVAVDTHQLALAIAAKSPLPVQQQEALRRAARLRTMSERTEELPPLVTMPYRLFGWPQLDVAARWSTTGGHARIAGTTTRLAGDLLYGTADVTVSSLAKASDTRWSFGRQDPLGGVLGAPSIRTALIGDIYDPGVDLVVPPGLGRAATVSSFPLLAPSRLGTVTLAGRLDTGWLVELYQDGSLIAQQQGSPLEEYSFVDVPLRYGANELQLVFLGPAGERRVEKRMVVARDWVPAAGDTYFRATVRDEGQPASIELEHGLHGLAAVSGVLTSATVDGHRTWFGGAGARGSMGRLFSSLEVVGSAQGGRALEESIATRLSSFDLSIRHTGFDGFTSPAELLDGARSRDQMVVFGRIGEAAGVPLNVRIIGERLRSGRATTEDGTLWLGAGWRGFQVSNLLRLERHDASEGLLLVSGLIGRASVRGRVDYKLHGAHPLRELGCDVQMRVAGVSAQLSVSLSQGPRQPRLALSIAKLVGRVGVIATASADRNGLTSWGQLSTGIRPLDGGRHFDIHQSIGSGDAVVASAFLDRNRDGTQQAGEPSLPGVTFSLDGAGRDSISGADGGALLDSVTDNVPAIVRLRTDLLDNPFLAVPQPALRIVPRKGEPASVRFALLVSGEVMGRVTIVDGGLVAGALILILDEKGAPVAQTTSAADGFYVASGVPPGRFEVRAILSKGGDRLRSRGRKVVIPDDGAALDGVDLVIDPATGSPAPP